jgi:hypothetical protein
MAGSGTKSREGRRNDCSAAEKGQRAVMTRPIAESPQPAPPSPTVPVNVGSAAIGWPFFCAANVLFG